MPQKSDRQAVIDALLAMGWSECHRSRKYRCFVEPSEAVASNRSVPVTLLVGRSGALRKCLGDEPLSESLSLTGSHYHKTLAELGRTTNPNATAKQHRHSFRRMLLDRIRK